MSFLYFFIGFFTAKILDAINLRLDALVKRVVKSNIDHNKEIKKILVKFRIKKWTYGIVEDEISNFTFSDPSIEEKYWPIGSISKPIFADLLLSNGFHHTQKIGEIYCDSTIPKRILETSIGEIFSHTSGIPRMPENFLFQDSLDPYKEYDDKKLEDSLFNIKFKNRGEYLYSNYSLAILGHILEKKYPDIINQTNIKWVRQYGFIIPFSSPEKNDQLLPSELWSMNGPFKFAGGAWMRTKELHKYINSIYLKEKLIDLFRPVTDTGSGSNQVCLGWHYHCEKKCRFYWHNGMTGSAFSFVAFSRERKCSFSLFLDTDLDLTENAISISRNLFR